MLEYENVKDALKKLLEVNSETLAGVTITEGNNLTRPFNLEDLQTFNHSLLVNVCDLIGLESLYLEETT